MADKKSFIFYQDWYDMVKDEPDEIRLSFLEAIPKYFFEGVQPIDPMIRLAFKPVISIIQRNEEKWQEIKVKRREAGRKGAEKTNAMRWGQQTSANIGKSQQVSAKSADNDNVNVNEDVNDNIDNKPPSKEEGMSLSHESDSQPSTEGNLKVKEIIVIWNDLVKHKAMQSISAINEGSKRKKNVRARIKEYGEPAFRTMLEKAASSDFLNGSNPKNWMATFDWLILPSNFPKVLEGNYDNKPTVDAQPIFKPSRSSWKTDDEYRQEQEEKEYRRLHPDNDQARANFIAILQKAAQNGNEDAKRQLNELLNQ